MLRPVALALLIVPFAASAVETMRIHMGDADEVSLQGEALGLGLDEEEGRFTQVPSGRSRLRLSGGKLLVDGALWPEESIRFRAGDQSSIRALGTQVRGDVVVRVHRGRIQLINVIPLEDYLAAVLGSEMPRTFPEEALKAQAVAARTYALHKKLEAYGQPFHLGSSVLHQVYGGVEREDPRTRAAVEATRGEVLTWELQPIEAYFHSSCGGRTERGAQALGRNLPYLASVRCPCASLPQSRWEVAIPAAELQRALGFAPSRLAVSGRTSTGRVMRLVDGRQGMDAVTFRQKMGYSRIRSLDFEFKAAGAGGMHFSGKGFGHGAGLCQWGAKALADRASGYLDILEHYYPGTDLQTLY